MSRPNNVTYRHTQIAMAIAAVNGIFLAASSLWDVNTFSCPDCIAPRPLELANGAKTFEMPPHSFAVAVFTLA